MNVLCQFIAGAELHAIREESCRIEGKADTALAKCVDVAADTSIMLKKAADAIGSLNIEKLHATLSLVTDRQKWLAQEINKQGDYLSELHNWLCEHHGGTYELKGVRHG